MHLAPEISQVLMDNFPLIISLFALISSWGIFFNSKRAFAAGSYPKITADLALTYRDQLPLYTVYNESDKIAANDIRIKVSIIRWSEIRVFKGRWFTYYTAKIARLKPGEPAIPTGLESTELKKWFKDRGFESTSPMSLADQEIIDQISVKKQYSVRLVVNYTSQVFGADRVCQVCKHYKLVPQSNLAMERVEDQFYWKLES